VLIPLWNVWYFFALYANSAADGAGYDARLRADSSNVLDRYVLAKAHDLVAGVTEQLDAYDIAGAAAAVRDFIDGLTNWYVRRSRDRFWDEEADAFDTLYTVLETLTRVVSPLLPMVGEEIWRGLTGGRSVHLTDWPSAQELPADDELVAAMDAARSVCSVALAIRKANGLRVRQPLRTLTIAGEDSAALEPFVDLIKEEVNVKAVRLESLATTDFTLVPNARALGPRLGKDVQFVIKAAKAGEFTDNHDGTVTVAGHDLREGEFELKPAVKDPQGSRFEAGRLIALDTELDEVLEAEGWVRDVVRQVQDARKAAGLHVSDTVRLSLTVPQEKFLWADHHREFIAGETLAKELVLAPAAEPDVDDVAVEVTKVG
jgi:isoleucyl-tRNA synthetase